MLLSCADYGAWMECTMSDEATGNTALHKAVLACQDYADFEAEAKRLKIKKSQEYHDYIPVKSAWRKKCETNYQVQKLKDEVDGWASQRKLDVGCVAALCAGLADPMLWNAEGKTALDLAATKHPEVIDQLERQVQFLAMIEENAEDNEDTSMGELRYVWRQRSGIAKGPKDMDDDTGLFHRDKYFMRTVQQRMEAMEKKAAKK